jgi:predicted amidohydrolase
MPGHQHRARVRKSVKMEDFRLAVVQMTSLDNIERNLAAAVALYEQGAKAGAQLVVFPENTLFFRIQSGSKLQAPVWTGPEIQRLTDIVNKNQAALMLTTATIAPGGKFRNSTILFRPGENPEIVYSKIHLFDVDVPGAPPVRESDHFEGGRDTRIITIAGWKFGLSICYDLRFAELYLRYAGQVDAILIPSAFLVPTGEAHWETLVRARAIENQCYVAAPAQAGEHRSGQQARFTYGHTMVADPWGRVLCELLDSPEIKLVRLQAAEITKVREQIPMSTHRRLQ